MEIVTNFGSVGIKSISVESNVPISKYFFKAGKYTSFVEFEIGVYSFSSSNLSEELEYQFYVVDQNGVSSDIYTTSYYIMPGGEIDP